MPATLERPRTRSTEEILAAAERLSRDFAERAAAHDRDGSFPFENFEQLHAERLLNLTVPVALGGEGFGVARTARVVETIAAGDPSTALVLTMQYLHHAGQARRGGWAPGTYQRILNASLAGVALINSARVEPELGTPARGGLPATIARRVEGGWSLSGRKIYTTGAPILRFINVWARTDEAQPRLGGFLVTAGAPGSHIEPTWDHVGLRASRSDDLVLDNVFVAEDQVSGLAVPGAPAAAHPELMAWNALVLSALYTGVAKAARDWLAGYLNTRTPSNLGAPLASLPRHQTAFGEIEALLFTSERLIHGAAREIEAGESCLTGSELNLVKSIATNNAVRAVKLGLALIGNPGLSRANPLERHYRDVLCGPVHTPQDDAILAVAGRAGLAR